MCSIMRRSMMKCGSWNAIMLIAAAHTGVRSLPMGVRMMNRVVARVLGNQGEGAPVSQDERVCRLDSLDGPPELRPEQPAEIARLRGSNQFPNLALLPLGPNLGDVVNVDAEGALQPVVAVEAGAILPELDQPWPDGGGRGVHGDGTLNLESRIASGFVTRQHQAMLGCHRPPRTIHRPHHRGGGIGEKCHRGGRGQTAPKGARVLGRSRKASR